MKKTVVASLIALQSCALVAFAEEAKTSQADENAIKSLVESIEPGNMMITDFIKLGVETEFLGTYLEGSDNDDFVLDTLDFILDVYLTDKISFNTVFEYSGADDDYYIDSAQFDVQLSDSLSATVGKTYLPFGRFNSEMITDPLTVDFGEMRKTTAGLTYNIYDNLSVSAWLFNGDIDEEFKNYAVTLEMSPVENVTVGAGLISDISESSLSDYFDAADDHDAALGVNAWVEVSLTDDFALYGEFMGAVEGIDELNGDAPRTWALDLSYSLSDSWVLGARYEGTSSCESLINDIPNTRFGGAVTHSFNDFISVTMEYLYSEYDSKSEHPDCHALAGRLAIAF